MVKLFADVGKVTKKLLGDDYIADTKVSLKSTTPNGISFTVETVQAAKSDAVDGTLSIKSKVYGNAVTTKLASAGKVSTEVTMDQLGVKGLKAIMTGAVAQGSQTASAKLEYLHPHLAATALVDVFKGPSLHATVNMGVGALAVGAEALYDTSKASVTKYAAAVTRVDRDSEMTLHAIDNLRKLKASYSHAVQSDMVLGAEMLYDRDTQASTLTMGAKVAIDKTATVKTKLNSAGMLSLSYISTIRPETTVVLSSQVDVKKMEASPRLGLSVSYEA
eukprot:Plantae.Rhodophyta-Rhodochaete_pulchella.ctg7253.p1 GENE.Plantae.Rhodophyta-Rhodochaete_pulchella.ctg7253~~Plantae.Rhodophyta-Rhodochaete_pulchella.ctg7253.p1  ORF type:complete len:307 (+),score=58.15 Plantae.Rhodophyta-Rhodochaete_pulchella.ctg7253:95-922(+)